MTSIKPILAFGRSVGVENFGAIKRFVRAAQTLPGAQSGRAALHMDLSPEALQNAFINTVNQADLMTKLRFLGAEDLMAQMRALSPEIFAKGNRSIIDILIQKFGAKSGKFTLASKVVAPQGEVVADAAYTVLGNNYGIRAVGAGTGTRNAEFALDTFIRNGVKPDGIPILKNIQYNVENGIANLNLPKTNAGAVTAQGHLKLDEEIMNKAAAIGSGGAYTDYGKAVQDAKKLLG